MTNGKWNLQNNRRGNKNSNTKQTAIENKYHSEERHNKLSQDAKSSDGNVKDNCNVTTREGKPVTDRFSALLFCVI